MLLLLQIQHESQQLFNRTAKNAQSIRTTGAVECWAKTKTGSFFFVLNLLILIMCVWEARYVHVSVSAQGRWEASDPFWAVVTEDCELPCVGAGKQTWASRSMISMLNQSHLSRWQKKRLKILKFKLTLHPFAQLSLTAHQEHRQPDLYLPLHTRGSFSGKMQLLHKPALQSWGMVADTHL